MKLPESKSLWAIITVIVVTLAAQIPGITNWIKEVTNDHAHLVTVIEGIIGVVLLMFATSKGETPGVAK